MKQNDLNREVARMTGETVDRIQRLGFNLVVIGSTHRPPRRANVHPIVNVNVPAKPIARHQQVNAIAS